jgi:hypothetical protein
MATARALVVLSSEDALDACTRPPSEGAVALHFSSCAAPPLPLLHAAPPLPGAPPSLLLAHARGTWRARVQEAQARCGQRARSTMATPATRLPSYFPIVPKECKEAAKPFFDCFNEGSAYEAGKVRALRAAGAGGQRRHSHAGR